MLGFDQLACVALASLGGVDAFAGGSFASVTLTAPVASAAGNATVSGTVASIGLASPVASAVGGAAATGGFTALTLSSVSASAGGGAASAGSVAALTIASVAGSATGSAAGQGALPTLGLSAPAASAMGAGAGQGAPSATSLAVALGGASGGATVSGVLPAVTFSAPEASATGTKLHTAGVVEALAAGDLVSARASYSVARTEPLVPVDHLTVFSLVSVSLGETLSAHDAQIAFISALGAASAAGAANDLSVGLSWLAAHVEDGAQAKVQSESFTDRVASASEWLTARDAWGGAMLALTDVVEQVALSDQVQWMGLTHYAQHTEDVLSSDEVFAQKFRTGYATENAQALDITQANAAFFALMTDGLEASDTFFCVKFWNIGIHESAAALDMWSFMDLAPSGRMVGTTVEGRRIWQEVGSRQSLGIKDTCA